MSAGSLPRCRGLSVAAAVVWVAAWCAPAAPAWGADYYEEGETPALGREFRQVFAVDESTTLERDGEPYLSYGARGERTVGFDLRVAYKLRSDRGGEALHGDEHLVYSLEVWQEFAAGSVLWVKPHGAPLVVSTSWRCCRGNGSGAARRGRRWARGAASATPSTSKRVGGGHRAIACSGGARPTAPFRVGRGGSAA